MKRFSILSGALFIISCGETEHLPDANPDPDHQPDAGHVVSGVCDPLGIWYLKIAFTNLNSECTLAQPKTEMWILSQNNNTYNFAIDGQAPFEQVSGTVTDSKGACDIVATDIDPNFASLLIYKNRLIKMHEQNGIVTGTGSINLTDTKTNFKCVETFTIEGTKT